MKYIAFFLVVGIPLVYAYEVGGSFGIQITVVNETDDTIDDVDDTNDEEETDEIDTEIYYHSYIALENAVEREENYAFTGEEIFFEIYVSNDEEVDEVILELINEEIKCKKKNSKISNGKELPDEFSEQADYNSDEMDYYECSFIVGEFFEGNSDIEIKAYNDDNEVLEKEKEEFSFNPSLTIEVSKNSNEVYVQNKDISLDIKQSCNKDTSSKLEPGKKKGISLGNCSEGDYIIGMVI